MEQADVNTPGSRVAPSAAFARSAASEPTGAMARETMGVVLLGPPGAGKGTQAARIAAHLEIPHIATGDMLRANLAEGTPLGRVAKRYMQGGELVPDDIVFEIVAERLAQPDCHRGFVLDGFPRSVAQARALSRHLEELGSPLDAALSLEVDEEKLVHRLSARARADDDEQTVRSRLRVFAKTNGPLVAYYEERDLLATVDADGEIDEITQHIVAMLEEVARHPLRRRLRAPAQAAEARSMRMALLGPPGAGKGTQGARLATHFGIPHIATGDIFRANMTKSTPLGRMAQEYVDSGELVPDDIVFEIVAERLAEPDCRAGFALDGFPRSLSQAEVLDRRLNERGTPLDVALYLDVPEEELVRRAASRARPDDDEEILRARLRVFNSTTRPLVDHYDDRDLLVCVDGTGEIEHVTNNILVGLVNFALLGQALSRHRRRS
jgi:adenylate kinase